MALHFIILNFYLHITHVRLLEFPKIVYRHFPPLINQLLPLIFHGIASLKIMSSVYRNVAIVIWIKTNSKTVFMMIVKTLHQCIILNLAAETSIIKPKLSGNWCLLTKDMTERQKGTNSSNNCVYNWLSIVLLE